MGWYYIFRLSSQSLESFLRLWSSFFYVFYVLSTDILLLCLHGCHVHLRPNHGRGCKRTSHATVAIFISSRRDKTLR